MRNITKNVLVTGLISLFTFSALFAQMSTESEFEHGELLLRVKNYRQIDLIVSDLKALNGIETMLKSSDLISPQADIWLFTYDQDMVDPYEMLHAVKEHRSVEEAQFNHKITMRETVPNDPQFNQQWHHKNTGQTGGTSGADIGSADAWDITTGGLTAQNDEIVVCIIEGANMNHSDLSANHWVNSAEIPNNGVDDDGNGYVDDYLGWNPDQNNDNVLSGSHGTSVAGMIGAVGDNNTGVAGANWDVKMMVVEVGSLNESNVIASYTYPLTMRQLYNSTNGAQGAFVVSTNASWGIDNANPDNYPLWCDFYNTLGEEGILNCGATANNNVNIDVNGDMPTACSSPYMVSVTASNHNDVRTFSGYGVGSINVAAPGESVRTTSGSTSYTSTSGTSFASPLTAGVIGLLYAAPCESFINLVKSDPQAGADYVRQALYNGVDVKSNLLNEVSTGGRINSFTSLQLILNDCNDSPCSPNLEATTTEDCTNGTFSIELQITDGDTPGQYNVLASVNGGGTTTVVNNQSAGTYSFGAYTLGDAVDLTVEFIGNSDCNANLDGVTSSDFFTGCTDPSACNYDPDAVCDDGSCVLNNLTTVSISTDCWGEEVSWNINDEFGNTIESVDINTYGDEQTYNTDVCLEDGCYTFNIADVYGDGMYGSQWSGCTTDGNYTVTDSEGNVVVQMADPDYGTGTFHDFCITSQPDVVCDPGYFDNGGVCTLCPPGTYCPGDGNSYPCSAGTYQSVSGATACIDCEAGSFSSVTGSTSCQSCPVGTFQSETGSTECVACAAGTSQSQTGQTSCDDCPAGTYSDIVGAATCQDCPAGTANNQTAQTSCPECPAGSFSATEGSTECSLCPADTYSDVSGSSECTDCPSGSSSDPGSTACAICDPGYFDNGGVCTLCPPGTYCPGDGNSYPCSAGTYQSVSGATACIDCEAGSFSSVTGSTSCQSCPVGTFQSETGSTECVACAAGSSQSQTGQTSCVDCPAGTYSDIVGAATCQDCAAGTANNQTGQTSCPECPAGSFSATEGSTECSLCPADTYSDVSGSSECTDCPSGSSSDPGSTACAICDPGYFDNGGVCTLCPPGTYCPGDGNSYPCSAGTYQSVSGATACIDCEAGSFSSVTGSTSCQSCPVGTFQSETGSTECVACAAGTSQSQTGQTSCVDCPAGTYSDIVGAATCQDCPAGTANNQTAQTSCPECPAGSFSATEGSTECSLCPADTYSDVSGSSECTDCPSGSSSDPGSTACAICDPGYFDNGGVCTLCPPGTYCPGDGNSYPCAPGTYQSEAGAIACINCSAGEFSDITGATSCEPCPAGTFQEFVGSSSCMACPSGTYQDQLGATDCFDCPEGTDSAPGAIECEDCNSYAFETETVCETYLAPDGQEFIESGEYIVAIPNNAGCDSVITISLTVIDISVQSSSSPATPGFADGTASVSPVGGDEPYTYQWNDSFLQTTSTAVGLFQGNYSCEITDANGCSISVDVTVPLEASVPDTWVHNSYCNTVGHELSDFIACNVVQNADAYRWLFTEQGGSSLPEYTRFNSQYIRLQWMSGIQLGTTYEVLVKARVNGEWGEYSLMCTITTDSSVPLTELRPEYHPTNTNGEDYGLCDFAIAYSVSNATNYRWRFDPDFDSNNGNEIVYTRGTSNSATRLSWVNGLVPGTTYNVAVKAMVSAVWGDFGTAHAISMANPPGPVLRANFCNQTYEPNSYVLSTSVCAANYYQFKFEPVGGGAPVMITSGNYVAFFNNASPSLTPGDYEVSVRVNQSGVLGEYGTPCVITISGPESLPGGDVTLRQVDGNLVAELFPNPNSGGEVRIEISGLPDSDEPLNIGVYDLYGRKISDADYAYDGERFNQLVTFDRQLSMGVYMVRIAIGQDVKSVQRIIVK